ncbi:MAG: hypothetical protein G8345_21590, partial [Magnetococcales bacterium]|nr:hypothetical protein [Magnetococcales bacterium]
AVLVKYQKNRDELVQHRRKFQTAQQSGRFASLLVPLRTQTWGGGFAAVMPLSQGLDLANARWCITGEEARGLSRRGEVTMVAMANELRLLDSQNGRVLESWQDKLFRNLHSVEFHPQDSQRVLLANSGFDQILEYHLTDRKVVWQWQAWENGYHHNPYGLGLLHSQQALPEGEHNRLLSREEAMEAIRREDPIPGEENWWVRVNFDGVEHPLGLEKWLKGAEPNWAGYDPHGHGILATFFVASQAVCLDPATGQVKVIKKAFGRPHGLVPWQDGYVISATRRGHATLLDHDFRTRCCYQFTTMPLPATYAESDGEWLQFTNPIGNGLLATVDSRRATVFVWDPQAAIYERYPFNRDWEVHSVMGYEGA